MATEKWYTIRVSNRATELMDLPYLHMGLFCTKYAAVEKMIEMRDAEIALLQKETRKEDFNKKYCESVLKDDSFYMWEKGTHRNKDVYYFKIVEIEKEIGRYVYAVRIFDKYGDCGTPMAELAFGDGGRPTGETITIRWDSLSEREKYFFNSYTLIWDERYLPRNKSFKEYLKGE